MIVKVTQTESNTAQVFDVESDSFYYCGQLGSMSKYQPITLSGKGKVIRGTYKHTGWQNHLPCRWIFGKESVTMAFDLYNGEEAFGNIVYREQGFLKSMYVITLDSGESFQCYYRAIDLFRYVSIYHNDTQIALVETYTYVRDYKYTHKLYILDSYDGYADVLSFFVLYYANNSFSKRLHMSRSSTYERARSYSKYNDKYDPKWRETHFPNDNFFGKLSIFSK